MSSRRRAIVAVAGVVLVSAGMWSSSREPEDADAVLAGKVVLITGSTDGLGREVARRAAA